MADAAKNLADGVPPGDIRRVHPPPARLTQLDGLRGLAALSVVAFHYTSRFDDLFGHTEPLPFVFAFGTVGVQLFFVISGFVIHMTLERAKSPWDFVVSRFSRLFPVYWTSVLVTAMVLLWAAIPGYQPGLRQIAANLTMVQELFGVPSIDGVYWTLEIEMLFYVWMLAIWLMGLHTRPTGLLLAWTTLALASRWLRLPWPVDHALLLEWIPWFAIGITAYVWLRDRRLSTGGAAVLSLAFAAIAARSGVGPALWSVCCLTLVCLASRGLIRTLNAPPLLWLGAISYPLYLMHEKVGSVLIMRLEAAGVRPVVAILAAVALSLMLASTMHALVEKPALRSIRGWYGQFVVTRFRRLPWLAACGIALFCAVTGIKAAQLVMPRQVLPPRLAGINGWTRDTGTCPGWPVLVVLGQSNAASHGELGEPGGPAAHVFHEGRCGLADVRLPGTSGLGAAIWPGVVAQLQVDLLIAPLAVGSTTIDEWTRPDGEMRGALVDLLASLRRSGLTVKAVAWQQGEADSLAGTAARAYQAGLQQLEALLAEQGVDAPLFIARSTYCEGAGSGAIRRAIERHLAASTRSLAGPDTDRLQGADRSDDCHFSQAGLRAAATLWAEALRPHVR